MDPTIEVAGLRKRYGATMAVDDLTFTVRPGQVTGFVGPNGAGKSTTMRIVLGLDAADAGTARIGGRPYRSLTAPLTEVGALLDAEAIHPGRRAKDHLLWMAQSNGLPARRVGEVLDQVGLASAARRRAGGFSLGMRQRLGIAAAMLGDPPVLIFDEPVNGLDPEGMRWIRGYLRGLAAEGRAILVSSHLMSELEETADHLVVIGRGRMVADTSVADLVAEASGTRVLLRTSQRTDAMTLLARAGATVAVVDHDAVTVDGLSAERIAALLGASQVPFSELSAHRATLEEAYMELTRDAVEFGAQGSAPVIYSTTVPSSGAGFGQVLRAEWTKLRSLRSTWICVVLTIGLTILLAYLAGKGNTTDANKFGPQRFFQAQLVHQTLDGDGSIVAHVAKQEKTGPDAKAGLMISGPVTAPTDKAGPGPAPAYAAIMVTPGHGVLWQSDFAHEAAGTTDPAPRWLKLTRAGSQVTGYESPDGVTWTQVGTSEVTDLPATALVGMFVSSPPTGIKSVRRSPTSTESSPDYTLSTAVFDSVRVTGADGQPGRGSWQHLDTTGPPRELPHDNVAGSFTEDAGRFTVSGAGDLGVQPPGSGGDNDVVRDSLAGIFIGFIAMAVVAALYITTEFRRGIIRTTFTATPRRGRVLAAKAVVLAATAFVTGVAAAVPAFLISQPLLRENGFAPPAYPRVSLTDGPVLRAVVGTGLVLALLAVLALALGALFRSSAAAITAVIALVVLPLIIGPFLTLGGEAWLKRVTPGAGMAIQQTRERWDDAIGPWPGIAVLCGWVAVALVAAVTQLRRRDA